MALSQPLAFDASGRTAQCDAAEHVRQQIETLLFTRPGERVNRSDLGSGLFQMVFAPDSDEVATATQYLVQSALQRWLGSLAQIVSVEVAAQDAVLAVTVVYRLAATGQMAAASFQRPV